MTNEKSQRARRYLLGGLSAAGQLCTAPLRCFTPSLEDFDDMLEPTDLALKAGNIDNRWKDVQSAFEQMLRMTLGVSMVDESLSPEERHAVLDGDTSVEAIAKRIRNGQYKKIVVMSGAGVSTSAGIPDFRSPGTGLYDNLQKYNLPSPQMVFDIEYFKTRPDPFFMVAKELYPGHFKPTATHYFIRLLAEKGLLLRNYTQNVDTLERLAGIHSDLLVEAHGSFATAHCSSCKEPFEESWVRDEIFADRVPRCCCGGIVKPDIVFFGEPLPRRFAELNQKDLQECDLLIVLGTSLKVRPFSDLVGKCKLTTPRLLINMEEVGTSLYGGFTFGHAQNYRDVKMIGACDDGVRALAEMLGWTAELDALIGLPEPKEIPHDEPAVCVVQGTNGNTAVVSSLQPEEN